MTLNWTPYEVRGEVWTALYKRFMEDNQYCTFLKRALTEQDPDFKDILREIEWLKDHKYVRYVGAAACGGPDDYATYVLTTAGRDAYETLASQQGHRQTRTSIGFEQ